MNENAAMNLLTSIAVLCVASAAVGAILQYWRDALHYDRHRVHTHRVHDWLVREIRAWQRAHPKEH